VRWSWNLGVQLSATLIAVLCAGELAAQDPTEVPAPATTPSGPGPVSPGRAFLRAILVPGWGHASIGEHTRGGFYFLTETAAAWMVVRTRSRLNAATDVRELRLAEVRARLQAEGVDDPAAIARAQDRDDSVIAASSLVEARSQQFEDWLVFGIFFVFLSGADAFVSAHLRDFPDPLGFQLRPLEDALEVGVSLPLGPRRSGR
jgi:hypothetical protein